MTLALAGFGRRIAGEPVGESFPARRFQIFLHGHGPDIAGATFIEMAGAAVMNGMFPAPVIIRGKRENA